MATTLTDRIKKAVSPTGSKPDQPPADPGARAKAEAALTAARDKLAAAHQAHQAAIAGGELRSVQQARRALELAQGDHEDAGRVYEAAKRAHDANQASAEQAKLEAAVGELAPRRYEVGTEIDRTLAALGKLYQRRHELDVALVALLPANDTLRYQVSTAVVDGAFREQLHGHGLPGGTRSLRLIADGARGTTCAELARQSNATALTAVKGKPKRAPGA